MQEEKAAEKMCEECRHGELCTNNIRLFRNLDDKYQRELTAHASRSYHAKGEVLVEEGDPIDSILIVRKGRIKTCRIDGDGSEHVLDVLHDGQAIWHGMFLEDHVYHYAVVCLSDVWLCEIRRDEFENVLKKEPEVAMSLITMLSTELDDAEQKAMLLGIRSPKKRLAGFLLYRDERCTGNEIHMKLDDIAASIGMRMETVSRNLTVLEREGMIERTGRGRIRVKNRDGLLKLTDR